MEIYKKKKKNPVKRVQQEELFMSALIHRLTVKQKQRGGENKVRWRY